MNEPTSKEQTKSAEALASGRVGLATCLPNKSLTPPLTPPRGPDLFPCFEALEVICFISEVTCFILEVVSFTLEVNTLLSLTAAPGNSSQALELAQGAVERLLRSSKTPKRLSHSPQFSQDAPRTFPQRSQNATKLKILPIFCNQINAQSVERSDNRPIIFERCAERSDTKTRDSSNYSGRNRR